MEADEQKLAQRHLLEEAIRDRYSEGNNGEELTDEELARVADLVEEQINDTKGASHVLAEEMKDGEGAMQMRQLNLAIGLQAGMAMLEGVIRAAPGMSDERKNRLVARIDPPEGIRKDHYGAATVEFPAGRGSGPEAARPRKIYLRCAGVQPDHDFAAELAKIRALVATEEEGLRIEHQLEALLLQARQAYIALVDLNPLVVAKVAKKYEMAGVTFDFRRFCFDGANKTLYFRTPAALTPPGNTPKKMGPCAGLVVEHA